ncbi:hypothetical protein MC45_14370 [Sphingomonas taxi]|uniref:Uncharacterized protein n=1 Tax=Sphingomonas taxi TaxID=1549858 RepID=A0A097EIH1_9SPHN|nr:hypothetical protein MC45_14370 [Sphingomonas taxi]
MQGETKYLLRGQARAIRGDQIEITGRGKVGDVVAIEKILDSFVDVLRRNEFQLNDGEPSILVFRSTFHDRGERTRADVRRSNQHPPRRAIARAAGIHCSHQFVEAVGYEPGLGDA